MHLLEKKNQSQSTMGRKGFTIGNIALKINCFISLS
jgi:hypothetical protein